LDRLLIQRFDAVTAAFYKMIVPEKFEGYTPENFEDFIQKLEVYEKELAKRGTPFFGGKNTILLCLNLQSFMFEVAESW